MRAYHFGEHSPDEHSPERKAPDEPDEDVAARRGAAEPARVPKQRLRRPAHCGECNVVSLPTGSSGSAVASRSANALVAVERR